MNVYFDSYYSNYPTANRPMFIQSEFTEVNYLSIEAYRYGSYHTVVKDSTFTESRVRVTPSQYSVSYTHLTLPTNREV